MMNKKLIATTMAALMALSLAACGESGTASSKAASTASTASVASGTTSTATSGAPTSDPNYKVRTSDSQHVVNENGEFTKAQVKTPILVTSIGQSADVSMLDALLKKVNAQYTYNATATASDVASAGTVIIASGASSKGLGAAGLSIDAETARAKEIMAAAKEHNVVVIMAHLGGAARRGSLSDQFNDLVMNGASYMMIVEDGNADGHFTNYAEQNKIPVTLLKSISDAVTPLKTLFG